MDSTRLSLLPEFPVLGLRCLADSPLQCGAWVGLGLGSSTQLGWPSLYPRSLSMAGWAFLWNDGFFHGAWHPLDDAGEGPKAAAVGARAVSSPRVHFCWTLLIGLFLQRAPTQEGQQAATAVCDSLHRGRLDLSIQLAGRYSPALAPSGAGPPVTSAAAWGPSPTPSGSKGTSPG